MKFLPYCQKLKEATGSTVCVGVQHWVWGNGGGAEVQIRLSFLPGLDGSKCSDETFTSAAVFQARCAEILNKYRNQEAV